MPRSGVGLDEQLGRKVAENDASGARQRTAHRRTQLPIPSESRAACAQPDAAARKRCNGRECRMVCCREKPRAHPDTEAGTNRLAKLAQTVRNPAEESAGELHWRFARRSGGNSFCSALTPELSRATKWRRLGRTVRAQSSRKRRQRGAPAHGAPPHAVACTVREPSRLRATRCGRKETLQHGESVGGSAATRSHGRTPILRPARTGWRSRRRPPGAPRKNRRASCTGALPGAAAEAAFPAP